MADKKPRVMIVDDEPTNLELLGDIFDGLYEIITTAESTKALDMATQVQPDLILLDIMMPVLDGFAVCQQLKAGESTCDIPIIFLTGMAETADEAKGFALGAVDYIAKPFSPTIICARVKNQIELKQLRDQERAHLQVVQNEKVKSELLLTNVLPETVANRLKESPGIIAESYDEATVLFADLVGFTKMSERISASRLVEVLNDLFSTFDLLVEKYGSEKIKTIGDAYMAVNGVHSGLHTPTAVAELALAMVDEIEKFAKKYNEPLQVRIGIHTGPVMAGVIGHKRLVFDLWGDTVNTASRMESHSLPGFIQVSGSFYQRIQDEYDFDKRGAIHVKGKGEMVTYFLLGTKGSKRGHEVQESIKEMGQASYTLSRAKQELDTLSLNTDLTGVRTQSGFAAAAEQQLILAQRLKRNVLLMLVSLANWDNLVRSYEMNAVDNAVKNLGKQLYSIYRTSDLVGRLGENLFLVFGMEGDLKTPGALSLRLENGWPDILRDWPVSENPQLFKSETVWHHKSPLSLEETLSRLEADLKPVAALE